MSSNSSLFKPLQVGNTTIRNRIGMSAMSRNRSVPTTVPNHVNLEYYVQRAASAGLVITESALITPQGYVTSLPLRPYHLV
jgi:2,4-dienoyl-CoA reductase-like NADH-dependent reductase (Old Yellow Enzyme family)